MPKGRAFNNALAWVFVPDISNPAPNLGDGPYAGAFFHTLNRRSEPRKLAADVNTPDL
jgi:hypothetical protein